MGQKGGCAFGRGSNPERRKSCLASGFRQGLTGRQYQMARRLPREPVSAIKSRPQRLRVGIQKHSPSSVCQQLTDTPQRGQRIVEMLEDMAKNDEIISG